MTSTTLVDFYRLASVYRRMTPVMLLGAVLALVAGAVQPAPWLLALALAAILSAVWVIAVLRFIKAGAWGDEGTVSREVEPGA